VEQRSCTCVSLAWQAWRARPSEMKIMQGCAGLRVWPGGDRECLWISGLQGLSEGDHAGLRGGSLGQHSLGRAKEQGWRFGDPTACTAAQLAYRVGLGMQHRLFF
jgi:hypothetical protein